METYKNVDFDHKPNNYDFQPNHIDIITDIVEYEIETENGETRTGWTATVKRYRKNEYSLALQEIVDTLSHAIAELADTLYGGEE